MPIIFISINGDFIDKVKEISNYETYWMRLEEYKCKRKTYYISPANTLGFMDGGIDLCLSRVIFPNIEKIVKKYIEKYGKTTLLGRKYLPIGSSIIIKTSCEKKLVISPTMLLPQNVSKTRNAYFATIATLYNILVNKKENINDVDIIFTGMCNGCGRMDTREVAKQMIKAINEYKYYNPKIINEHVIINEPNLYEQPKYYSNSEWFNISPNEIEKE